jgi:hypothetical protein
MTTAEWPSKEGSCSRPRADFWPRNLAASHARNDNVRLKFFRNIVGMEARLGRLHRRIGVRDVKERRKDESR